MWVEKLYYSRVYKFFLYFILRVLKLMERNTGLVVIGNTGLSESWIKGIDLMPMAKNHEFNFLFLLR